MAKLTFRQGIVKNFQGGSTFLSANGDYVDLNATTGESVQITIVDGPKDYLFTENTTVAKAWGPFTSSDDQWLYWDIDTVTGVRTFGSTNIAPTTGPDAPMGPATGQMWFDTNEKVWKEWTGSSWKKVLRVFAAKFASSSTFQSTSINAPTFTGTQVGLTTTARAGAIVFDTNAKPILDSNNRFFTTEDTFFTGLPSGARLRIGNFIKTAQATENIPSFSVVTLDGVNSVRLATVSDQGRKVLGLVESGVSTGQMVSFTTEGVFFNQSWDWLNQGLNVNDPVYINNAGVITKTRQSSEQLPIGVVMDGQTIMFAPRLFPQLETEGDIPLENLTQSGATDGDVVVWNATNGQWEPADSGTAWGEISGTLSNQTDLQNALDSKVNLSGNETISGEKTFTDNMTVQGNLTVGGTTTTVNTEELVVSDNIIELNSDASGTPSENAGIRVNRGGSTDATVLWDESTDSWKVGLYGSETEIALVGHTHDTSDVVSGTFADARIAQSNVTQHESALTISFGQMSDSINDGQVPTSAVTQHEGALSLSFGQITDNINDSQVPTSAVTQHEGALTIATTQLTQGAATSGNFLRWDGTDWTASQAAISDLSDVDATTPSTGQSLTWDGANWTPGNPDTRVDVSDDNTKVTSGVTDINFSSYLSVVNDNDGTVTINVESTGVDALAVSGTAGTGGNLIEWNADGDAVDSSVATANLVLTSSSIDALNDVDTTSSAPSSSDVLTWDGSNWVPQSNTTASDSGSVIVTSPSDINFNTRLNVTDDLDGTVTIDIPITGVDANVVTGTAGASGNLIAWDANGDAVDSSIVTSNVVLNSDSINILSDVDTVSSAPTSGDFLAWDGSNWVPQPGMPTDISDNGSAVVTDVTDINFNTRLDVTDDGDGSVTVDIPITGVDTNIVTGTAGTSGNLVEWDGNGDVIDSTITASNVVLNSDSIDILNDVDTTSSAPSTDDVLTWDGSNWVPQAKAPADVSDSGSLIVSDATDINFNTRLNVTDDTDGTVTVDIPITGTDANVVTGTAGASGNIVEWNGNGDAVDSTVTTSSLVLTSSSVDALSDVDTTTSAPSTDDVLKWDGTNWVPQADTDTHIDVRDDGTLTVSNVGDINFSSYLTVTDDTDGTVTVNVESTGADALVVSGTAGTGGNLVEWNADGDAVDSTVATSNLVLTSSSIDALSDVDTTTSAPSTDDVLKWDGTNWVPQADTDTRTDVSDDGTTTVSAVSDINFSSYLSVTDDTDGTVTINVPATGIDSNLVSGTAGTGGNLVEWNADGDAVDSGTATSNLVLTSSSIDALSDVDTTTTAPSSGDVLQYDGTNWVPGTDTDTQTDVSDNGTTVVSSVTDINFSTNLNVTDDTDGTVTVDATDTNTQTDVSDNGTTVVSSVGDINFSSYLSVTDDTDGTVTVNVPATGIDSNLVSGTAGTSGNLIEWNADGDAVDSGTATSNLVLTSSSIDALNDVDTTTTAPSADDALAYDGTNWVPNNTTNWGVITSATTLSGTGANYIADTSGGSFTITLPSSPSNGQSFKFDDTGSNWGTNSLTVDGNGNNIDGSTSVTLSTSDSMVEFIFYNSEWHQRNII